MDMEVLKSLVPESANSIKFAVGSKEERVGGEAWHGSVAVISTPNENKKNRGSSLKQVSNYTVECYLYFKRRIL